MGAMLDHLGRACRTARLAAGLRQIDIATEAGITHATVSRFEAGRRWPIDVDAIVDAYGRECHVEPYDLWHQAVEDWRQTH